MTTTKHPDTCWRCPAETAGALVCPECGAPLAPPADRDLFAVLGLPRRLTVDLAALEEGYHAASRAVHPDRFQTAGGREREVSLAASAAVNRAYRTLRDPVARGRYWLELHGERLAEPGATVPPALAAEVFETQEQLAELRASEGKEGRAEVHALHDRLAARVAGLRDGLVTEYARWNGNAVDALAELKRRLAEIAYLNTLLGDVEDALGEGIRGTDRRH
jgi:molecular chaperone HscB